MQSGGTEEERHHIGDPIQHCWKELVDVCNENEPPIGNTLAAIITSDLTSNEIILFYEWLALNPEDSHPITPLLLVDVLLSLSKWKEASTLYEKGWRPSQTERIQYITAFRDIYTKGSPRKEGVILPNENTHLQRKWFIDHNIITEEEIPTISSPGRGNPE
jgi:hypothetical protein